jgi:hypothetical protein
MSDREFKVQITGDASSLQEASKQGGAAMQDMGQKGKEAHKEVGERVEKLGLKHKDLHAAIRALREEFPLLAHIAHAALNPVGFSVAAIVGAFALWQRRVETLGQLLGGLELPEIKSDSIGHITAASEAWGKFAESIRSANEALASSTAQNERAQANIARELELNRQLIQSFHDYAAAKLEAARSSMSPSEYQKRKLNLEADASAATAGEGRQAAIDSFAVKVSDVLDLRESAAQKQRAASGINVPSAEDDAKTLEKLSRHKEAAEKNLAERSARIEKLTAYKSGDGGYIDSLWVKTQQMLTGMSVDEMLDAENNGALRDLTVIGRQNNFRASMPSRDKARAERDRLLSGAASDLNKASGIEAGLPDEEQSLNDQAVATKKEQTMGQLTAAYKALSEVHDNLKTLQEEMRKSIISSGGYSVEVLKKMQEFNDLQAQLQKRIRALETSKDYHHL